MSDDWCAYCDDDILRENDQSLCQFCNTFYHTDCLPEHLVEFHGVD